MARPTPEGTRRYLVWRQAIPFTDEQIAGALDQLADEEYRHGRRVELRELARSSRRGYVGRVAVKEAMPLLVKVCAVCGGKAIYHMGAEGRCSAHRSVLPDWHYAKRAPEAHGLAVDAEVERDIRARDRAAQKFARWRAGNRRR